MRAADLDRARQKRDDLAAARRLAERVNGGEALRLLVGDANPQEVVLSAGYVERLRADLSAGFARREAELADELREIGVEP